MNRIRLRELPKYRRHLGVVFQDFRLLNDRNVYENVAFAQYVAGVFGSEARRNVTEVLKEVGLSSKYKSMPNELSGGEQQRAAIARALVNRPDILLADEPTGNLDEASSRDILDLLLEINRKGTTVVVVTHSRELIEAAGKRVIFMEKGMILDDIPESEQNIRIEDRAIVGMGAQEPEKRRGRSRRRPESVKEEEL